MSIHAERPPQFVRESIKVQYKTGRALGKGGFAICHVAERLYNDTSTGRIVALKIVKSKQANSKVQQKFITELQIHSKVRHPNIVRFMRAFSYLDNTYVVLEICENGSLADILHSKRRASFTMPEIRRFLIQTCGAVKYLHRSHVIHRDLKTGNLLLDRNMNIKLGDFGLAALLVSENDKEPRRTTFCGTPNYIAPEILHHHGQGHGKKVDLWAIGIVAYTLAVGKPPFNASTREDIYLKLTARDYAWPTSTPTSGEICGELKDVVDTLLVHEDRRPSPDMIVDHPFFRLGYVPETLDARCRQQRPEFPRYLISRQHRVRGFSDGWYKICLGSGVGTVDGHDISNLQAADELDTSDVEDCGELGSLDEEDINEEDTSRARLSRNSNVVKMFQNELEHGRQPVVPFPPDTVYFPYRRRKAPSKAKGGVLATLSEIRDPPRERTYISDMTARGRYGRYEVRMPPPTRIRTLHCTEDAEQQPRQISTKGLHQPERNFNEYAKTCNLNPPIRHRPSRALKAAEPTRSPKQKITRCSYHSQKPPKTVSMPILPVKVPREERRIRKVDSLEPMPQPSASPTPYMVPRSDPRSVLAQTAKLRSNIELLLQDQAERRSMVQLSLPFVSQWVDNSNKSGIGYILEDGSIGCNLVATDSRPAVHIIVPNGYNHMQRSGGNPTWAEELPMEVYIDSGDEGLSRAQLLDYSRIEVAELWEKFARYMCKKAPPSCTKQHSHARRSPAFVHFFQRIKLAMLCRFTDGSFQFNFPDHTKLVLSPDGLYCEFTHFSLEGVRDMQVKGKMPYEHIRSRRAMVGSLRTILRARKNTTTGQLADANGLRDKLQFIIEVIQCWEAGGGLGFISKEKSWPRPGEPVEIFVSRSGDE